MPPIRTMSHDRGADRLERDEEWLRWIQDPYSTIEVEIGSSYGGTLRQLALRSPEKRFIGIEIDQRRNDIAKRRTWSSALPNVCFVHADAVEVLRSTFMRSCIAACHIYFPSPEYLDSERRRRPLITEEFGASVFAALKNGGSLRVLTDLRAYFNRIRDVFGVFPFWSFNCEPLEMDLPDGFLAGTPLEYRYRPNGPIYSLHLVK